MDGISDRIILILSTVCRFVVTVSNHYLLVRNLVQWTTTYRP